MSEYEEALLLGQEAMQEGDLEQAKSHFLQALQVPEDWQEARRCLVRLALMKEQHRDAAVHLQVLLEADPEDAEALALQGLLLLQAKKHNEAVKVLETARELAPGLGLVYANLSLGYRALGRLDDALQATEKAVELDADHLPHHHMLAQLLLEKGRKGESMRILVAALEREPLRLATYVQLGALLEQAAHREQAIKLYVQGLALIPDAFVLRERLYDLYIASQMPEQALGQAQRLMQDRKAHGDALLVGRCLLMLGRFEDAEQVFVEAAAQQPDRWEVHFHLGEVYQVMQRIEESEEAYTLALQREPSSWLALNGLGQLLIHQKRHEEAIELLQRACDIAPQRPEPVLNMALGRALQGQVDDALELAEKVRQISAPGSATFEEAGRLIEALRKQG